MNFKNRGIVTSFNITGFIDAETTGIKPALINKQTTTIQDVVVFKPSIIYHFSYKYNRM